MAASADSGRTFVAGPATSDLTRQLDLPLPDLPPRHTLTILGTPGDTRVGLCGCGWEYPPTVAHPDVIAAAFDRHLSDVRC